MSRKLLQLLEANRHGRIADPRAAQRGYWRDSASSLRASPTATASNADPDKDGDKDKPGQPDEDDANADVANLYVYDVIDSYWGVTAQDVIRDLGAVKSKTINLHINSPGGDVFEARAIKTALEQHSARVVAFVDGLSASAASFLMLAADEIRIAKGAFVMIHNPWGFAMGDARDMRATADLLDQVADVIAQDYADKTGTAKADILTMMDAETWMDADEAIAKGFADSLLEKPAKASNLKRFDVSAYDKAPDLLAAAKALADEEEAFEEARARHAAIAKLIAVEPA
jgi:ATP-dependent Clp protease protease subunit